MRLQDAISAYLLALAAGNAPTTTQRTYTSALKRLGRYATSVGKDRLADLDTLLVRRCVLWTMDEIRRRHPRPDGTGGEAMAGQVVCAARDLARWLLAQGVSVDPLEHVATPHRPERIQQRVSADEFIRIESAVRGRLLEPGTSRLLVLRDLALISLLADTGLRASEVCALQVDSIDWDHGALVIDLGKGRKPRILAIADPDPAERDGGPTLRALADYLREREYHLPPASLPLTGPLFLSHKGKQLKPDEARRILARLARDAGIDATRPPHAYRRGHFTTAYQSDPFSLPVLVARMGWSPKSQEMVRTYTRGAELDLARTTYVPPVSRRWRGDQLARRPASPLTVQPTATQPPQRRTTRAAR